MKLKAKKIILKMVGISGFRRPKPIRAGIFEGDLKEQRSNFANMH